MDNQSSNNHKHGEGHGSSMMWMMILCCAVPILAILFLGGGAAALGGSSLLSFIALVLLVACVVMFVRHRSKPSSRGEQLHDHSSMNTNDASADPSQKAEPAKHDMKQDHSCCH